MKTQDELYQKVRLTSRVPQVVLKSNSQYGPQDPQSQKARRADMQNTEFSNFAKILSDTNVLNAIFLGILG